MRLTVTVKKTVNGVPVSSTTTDHLMPMSDGLQRKVDSLSLSFFLFFFLSLPQNRERTRLGTLPPGEPEERENLESLQISDYEDFFKESEPILAMHRKPERQLRDNPVRFHADQIL